MAGWAGFVAAFAAFFLTHAVPLRPPVRPALTRLLGRRGFTLAYSALSVAVLAWLLAAAGRAPFVPLWDWQPWHNHLVLTVMLPVALILALALGRPNPFSFGGGRADRFDPAHPGIVALLRHPLLVALALWAGAHLVANGDLAHALVFGAFAGFALLGGRLIDRRRRREMGQAWHDLARATAAAGPRPPPGAGPALAARLLAGAGLYLALLGLHAPVIGVSPLP